MERFIITLNAMAKDAWTVKQVLDEIVHGLAKVPDDMKITSFIVAGPMGEKDKE